MGSVRFQRCLTMRVHRKKGKNSHVHCVNVIVSSWSRRCLVIEIENLQKEKIVYTIPLMYNIKLGVHMYSLKVMYTQTFYFDSFSLMMENYENNLVFFLGHCRPETLISASLTYFHDSLWISPLFYVFCLDLIDFNPNSLFYIQKVEQNFFFFWFV